MAAPVSAWPSCTRSCRPTRARSGHARNWERERHSCCGCGAWVPGCDRVPPRATIRSCWQQATWMGDRRARWGREGEPMANILVCDDKRKIDGALYDIIITDIKMPNIDGIEVLRHSHATSPESAVILITAVDDYEAAVQAVKAGGASDYIRKGPGLVDEIKLAINRSLEKASLSKQNFAFRRDAAARNSLDNIIGISAAMEKLKQTIRTVASTSSTILIHGESGTGKELVARAVHVCSPRVT